MRVSPRRWLLLPIAHKTREYGGRAILALEAADRGWGVILGQGRLRSSADLPRGVVFERAIAPGLSRKMEQAASLGHRIIACCDEGLVYRDAEEYARRKIDPAAYEKIDWFFAWGDNQADDMIRGAGCDPRKIAVTGNTRFDLHRPELRRMLSDRADDIRRKYGPMILVNTKFSKHNGRCSLEEAIAIEKQEGVIRTPEDERFLRDWSAFQGAGFHGFTELVRKLSLTFPSHTIVVRPHPSEDPSPWREQAAQGPNIVVAGDGNVAEWLLAAEVSIHNNCTTGVEAYLLDRGSISYRPLTDPRFDMFLPNALSFDAFDVQSVCSLIGSFLSGKNPKAGRGEADRARIAAHYIANIGGESASARMMAVLDRMDIPKVELNLPPKSAPAGAPGILEPGRRLVRRLRSAQPNPRKDPNAVTVEELRAFLVAAQRATGRFEGVSVSEIGDGILCVYR